MNESITLLKNKISGNGVRCWVTGEGIYNSTWGHLAPRKNTSYKGKIIVMNAQHGEYGRGTLILNYDFGDINGPYTHEDILGNVADNIKISDDDTNIYEIKITFRNYVYHFGKIKSIFNINQNN